ncbi:MAG: 50S ribosomal protein L7/L12 [Clostridia bacterium]|nr:50S ribosomal protein L7/L12 [Clostridia bacterium]MBP5206934.1 50S ribosomal protein L7/L12 [Clostridia bacterium]
MASEKTTAILDAIKGLTIIELADLVKEIEAEFGVSAAVSVAAPAAGEAAPAVEEKTEFTVVLKGYDETKKMGIIKLVREVTGLGLKESKDLVTEAPKPIKEGVDKATAEALEKQFTEAGAQIELK